MSQEFRLVETHGHKVITTKLTSNEGRGFPLTHHLVTSSLSTSFPSGKEHIHIPDKPFLSKTKTPITRGGEKTLDIDSHVLYPHTQTTISLVSKGPPIGWTFPFPR